MTPRRKRLLTYVTIGIYFFLGGVEYAVILPTLWLYLHEKLHGDGYMLGIILSAMSLSEAVSGPIFGRWSDKTGNTKAILLFANLFEIVGSVMYFLGISQWFLVISRLVAGVGNGVGAAIFADIARVTSKQDRTSVMSSFMAIRQIGLIIGPGFNLFLRHMEFSIGKFEVNKYSAPGLFMALMWTIHEVFVLFMYWNLPKLKLEEELENAQDRTKWASGGHVPPDTAASIPAPLLDPGPGSLEPSSDMPYRPPAPEEPHSDDDTPPPRAPTPPRSPPRHIDRQAAAEDYCTSSNEFINAAETLMAMTPGTQRRVTAGGASMRDPHFQQLLTEARPERGGYGSLESSMQFTEDHFSEEEADAQGNAVTGAGASPASNSTSSTRTNTWPWRYYYDEFMREELVAILATVFVGFFNQCALETLLTPLTQKYLDWGELENSILYCIAGVEIIIIFLIIRCLSRKFSDSALLGMGFLVQVATVAFLTWFLPQSSPVRDRFGHYHSDAAAQNLPGLAVGIFFDLLSLPFLIVCSASLYSKITREETQGFAQGIRRVFVGCGTILGPLWAGGLMNSAMELYTMLGVMVGINVVAMVLMMLSFGKLRRQEQEEEEWEHSYPPATVSVNSDSDERRPLLR